MTAFFQSATVRAGLLALLLAAAAAVLAPAARGADGSRHGPIAAPPSVVGYPLPAWSGESWSWHEFVKYWERQGGSLQGVVGTVLLVGLGAVLLIMCKGRGK